MIRASAAIFILIAAVWLDQSQCLSGYDMKLVDAQFRLLRAQGPKPVANDVVIVGFDDTTTASLREPFTLWHNHLGKFLQAAAAGGATAVGIDVVLPDRSYDFVAAGLDRQLLVGILTARRATPVVLAKTVDLAGNVRAIHPPFLTAAGEGGTAFAILKQDADGVVRRFDEKIAEGDANASTLAGQMARRLGKPVNEGLIDFSSGTAFQFIPMQDVLAWFDAGKTDELKRAFEGRPVLLGSTFRFEDRLAAPVNLVGWEPDAINVPGVLLHAQALRNLMNGGLIQSSARWIPLALSVLAAMLWLWAPSPALGFATLGALIAGLLTASTIALSKGVHLPVINTMLVSFVALGGRQALEIGSKLRERYRLRKLFGGYVSPPVMQEILAGKLHPTLGGETQFGCLLFSDIRGYTTISERMTPEETIAFVNGYFDRLVPIIHAHGGTVICFMGDGIMAVFGIPQALDNACKSAFDCSRAMLDNLRAINAELIAKNEAPIDIGIGLHAGDVIAGHIGASERHEYSCLGDVTNVASRLEGLTKDVGYRIVISRVVAEMAGVVDTVAPLGPRNIKGHSAIEVFGYDKIDADAKAA